MEEDKENMKKIKFELTKEQKKHIKSIDWLFSEDRRREGRTFLLAYIYIKMALEGRKITIIDHAYITTGAGYRANKMLADVIYEIILLNKLPLKVNFTNLTLYKI